MPSIRRLTVLPDAGRRRTARRADRRPGVCHDRPVTSPVMQSALPDRVHHLQPAALTALAVALVVVLPELFGDLGRLAAVLVLQLGLVLTWVVVTGLQGFAGSLGGGAGARPPGFRRLAGGGRGCRGGRRSRPRLPGPADAGRPPGGLRRRFPRRRPPADAPASPGGPRRVPLRDGVPALLGRRPRGAPPPGPDAGRPQTGDGGAAGGRGRAGRGSSRRSRPPPAVPGHGRAAGPAGPGALGARRGGRR